MRQCDRCDTEGDALDIRAHDGDDQRRWLCEDCWLEIKAEAEGKKAYAEKVARDWEIFYQTFYAGGENHV